MRLKLHLLRRFIKTLRLPACASEVSTLSLSFEATKTLLRSFYPNTLLASEREVEEYHLLFVDATFDTLDFSPCFGFAAFLHNHNYFVTNPALCLDADQKSLLQENSGEG